MDNKKITFCGCKPVQKQHWASSKFYWFLWKKVRARRLYWSISVKSSVVKCLSNAVVKVARNCWERTLNFRNDTFFSFSSNCSLIPLFLNKNKNETTEYYGTFISFKSHLCSKQGSPILLLFGSWNVVSSCFGLSQKFFRYLEPANFSQENGKWILCFSNGAKWLSVRL